VNDTAVILLSAEATILARSGPPSMVGSAGAVASQLPGLFRGSNGLDLAVELAEVAKGDGGAARSLIVHRVDEQDPPPSYRLTLHPVAAGLVVGVVTPMTVLDGEGWKAVEALDAVWGGLSDAMAVTSTHMGAEGPAVLNANPAFAALLGMSVDELRGRSLSALLAPVHSTALDRRIESEVVKAGRSISDLAILKSSQGEEVLLFWELAPIKGSEGRPVGLVCVLRDSPGANGLDAFRRRADVDPLSGLPNQMHFLSRLQRAVERATRGRQYAFAVVGIEMRGLRAVERRLGPLVANTLLEAMVRRLKLRLRPGDLVARTGDRRLAILLDYVAPWGSLDEVMRRIHEATGDPFTIAGERITMSMVGAASPVWSGDYPPRDAQQVLDTLEGAAGRPKRTGVAAHPSNGGGSSLLAHAIEHEELSLTYLPLVSLATGEVVGLEALVRWVHPEHGVLAGHQFLADAEQAGVIVRLGRWVLHRVCRQLKDWEAEFGPQVVPPIHVNLSVQEFWDAGLSADLDRITAEADVDPSQIRLEVPEVAVARGVPEACRILTSLAKGGFGTWLDRFGEGGIRLCDLPALPVRHVKLAPTMVWGDGSDSVAPSPMLRSLLAIGHDLGWEVTVAGVETPGQEEVLRDAACDLAQGFHFSGLLDAAAAVALARQSFPRAISAAGH
jgi:PAS domain S-box-containing protein/diguanylate cyclase (GGDEF)-like protein